MRYVIVIVSLALLVIWDGLYNDGQYLGFFSPQREERRADGYWLTCFATSRARWRDIVPIDASNLSEPKRPSTVLPVMACPAGQISIRRPS